LNHTNSKANQWRIAVIRTNQSTQRAVMAKLMEKEFWFSESVNISRLELK
jgi:hypothetical protein